MDKRGFTLIELLITVAIIGILAAVAVTAYIGTVKKAARSEAYSNLESLRLLEEQFFADQGDYAPLVGGPLTGTPLIQVELPGFKPGPGSNFAYEVTKNMQIADNMKNTVADPPTWGGLIPCFTATATGMANTRVDGDLFTIDCNNNRNF